MTTGNSEQFYSHLQPAEMPLCDLLAQKEMFQSVPDDWHVVITDIVGSTQSVRNGRHEEVNLVATGSIVAVLNIAFGANVTIPFFFGGDGATFLVPSNLIDQVMRALAFYRTTVQQNFNFELRTGTVSVRQVFLEGHRIEISRFSSSPSFSIPVVLGNGLNYAEQVIKGKDYLFESRDLQENNLDLSGMQCRWDKIPPPRDKEEIVTLLVIASSVAGQPEAFRKIMREIDRLYGMPEKRQPLSVAKLRLKTTFGRLGSEMRVRLGKIKWIELLVTWLVMLYGHFYFKTRKGRKYLKALVEMSDTLVIDGKINTVISGTSAQRTALQQLLDQMEAAGEIIYGLHVSGASIMSCYVRNHEDDHIHFVDGSEGGYTKAAVMLKAKLK